MFGSALMSVLAGCSLDQNPDGLDRSGQRMMALRSRQREDRPKGLQLVQVQVMFIELPVGSVGEAEEVWSAVDEGAVPLRRSMTLAANGMRVGVGKLTEWAALAATLEELAGRKFGQSTLYNAPSQPMTLSLKQRQPPATVFAEHADKTLSGMDMPSGDYLLALLCSFDTKDPTIMKLTGVPQVRSTKRHTKVAKVNGAPTLMHRPMLTSIDLMIFQATVPAGGFVLIGPSAQAARPSSVGAHFLSKSRSGVPLETVIVLIPEIVER
ncbi:MAG: hypothetical protein ACYS8X_05615 [Planctomycetota bacterium]|jgi:hypothetical protein